MEVELGSERDRIKQDQPNTPNFEEAPLGPQVNINKEEILKQLEKEIGNDEKKPKDEKIILLFDEKKISIFKLYYHLSSRLDIFLMCLATIGSLGSGLSMPVIALLAGDTLSGYSGQSTANLPIAQQIALFQDIIGKMVTNFLAVGAAMFASFFIMTSLWTYVGLKQMHRMKELYFAIILKQEQGWFDANNAYEFSTKVQAQIKQMEGGVGEKFGQVIMICSQMISGIIIALTTSWKLTLVMLSLSPLLIFSVIFIVKCLKDGMIKSRKAYEKAGGLAEELLYNIKTVASFANFEYENDRFNWNINNCKNLGINVGLKLGIGIAFLIFSMFSTFVIAIIYGRNIIIDKEWNSNRQRVFLGGDVSTVMFATIMSILSLGILAPFLKTIQEACVASSDYFTLVERVPQMDLSKSTQIFPRESIQGRIEIRDVSFMYPSDPKKKMILKNINFVFEPGQKVALVGESGCGKSTVVNLIERLYDPLEGEIFIDGHNIKEFDINYLRTLIGYVQQEPVLFNKSIRENLIFGRDLSHLGNLDERIQEACEDAYANEFINKKDEKYEYLVGIKGSKLSGGQKQRVAIARAILGKPAILLLDEATSALDNKSEKEVQQALDQISAKKVTTIIIAHRLSTIRNADLIYAIKDGEVLEYGTHRELVAKNGYYAGLVRSQMGEDEQKAKEGDEEKVEVNGSAAQNVQNQIEHLPSSSSSTASVPEQNAGEGLKEQQVIKIDRKKLFSLLSENKCDMVQASLSASVAGAVSPIFGLLLALAINALCSTNESVVIVDGFFYAMMFLVIAFANGIAVWIQNWKFLAIGEVLTYKLRKLVIEKYLDLHMAFYDENENAPGALLTKLSIDTTQLNGLILTVIGVTAQSAVTAILGLVLGFIYDWRLGLIALCFIPFIIIATYLRAKSRKGGTATDVKLDIEAGSILSECVVNTKTIFSFNFQKKAVELYLETLIEAKTRFTQESILSGFFIGLGQFAQFAANATLFYAAGSFIMKGDLTFDNMNKAITILLVSATGIGNAQNYAGDFAKAKQSFESLFKTLKTKTLISTTVEANENKFSAKNLNGKIEFRNVTFAYPTKPHAKVLKNINFIIYPGQAVAFVGFSGCGKSTIIQLIERFYDVTKGEILIDDVNIQEFNLLELRKKIGLVSQEPCLFKRSVYDNILYGDLSASKEQVIDAATRANIMKFFKTDDVGTKEDPVSGGEKQRLAIARAFLKNPKILLLDEATSALDKKSEEEVQKSIYVLQGGRTSITIAHRLSTIENSDVIFVLESGRIVEKGTHQVLSKMNDKYATLLRYSAKP